MLCFISKPASLLAAILTLALPLSAHALSASQTVEKEITKIMPNGTTQIIRQSVEKIVPGERIVYTLNFTNDDNKDASNIVLTMPIPSEVAYIEGTADKAGVNVTYSADGGDTFSNRQSVMIIEASGNIRAAGANDLTHVRWSLAEPVAAGVSDSLSFSATVR